MRGKLASSAGKSGKRSIGKNENHTTFSGCTRSVFWRENRTSDVMDAPLRHMQLDRSKTNLAASRASTGVLRGLLPGSPGEFFFAGIYSPAKLRDQTDQPDSLICNGASTDEMPFSSISLRIQTSGRSINAARSAGCSKQKRPRR